MTLESDREDLATRKQQALGSGSLDRPLTGQERELIEQFLETRQVYQAITRQIEDALQEPLNQYQRQRHFYLDVSDLTHFRLNFFETVGHFLQNSLQATYQLELWDRQSHSKYCYTSHELNQADSHLVTQGHAVETIIYGQFNFRLRRVFDIQNYHLFRTKEQFFVAGKPVELTDGLMMLQRQLEDYTVWFRGNIFKIRDFT